MIRLKPFRSYSEHDVINLFALHGTTGDEGNFAKVYSTGWVSTQDFRTINLTSEANVVSQRRVNRAEVTLCTSGDDKGDALGVLLKNVRTVDYLGRDLVYDDVRKTEMNAVVSGETLTVLKRGMLLVSGIEGTPAVGSGIAVSNTLAGSWRSYNPAVETSVKTLGQILSSNDRDGYALCFIDC